MDLDCFGIAEPVVHFDATVFPNEWYRYPSYPRSAPNTRGGPYMSDSRPIPDLEEESPSGDQMLADLIEEFGYIFRTEIVHDMKETDDIVETLVKIEAGYIPLKHFEGAPINKYGIPFDPGDLKAELLQKPSVSTATASEIKDTTALQKLP